ncbi:MAG: hypothetical protein FWH32_08725 [Clostridiales bacterium]|nr:hypothetical protein [Clostridiales bacterium]
MKTTKSKASKPNKVYRVLAWALALTLVFTMVPAGVFAAEPKVEDEPVIIMDEEIIIEDDEAIADEPEAPAVDEEPIDEEIIAPAEPLAEDETILLVPMADAANTAVWNKTIAPDLSDWTGTDNLITIQAGAGGTLKVPAGVQLTIIGDGTVDGSGIDIVMGDDARVIWRADFTGDEVNLYMRQSAGELVIADGGAIRKTRGFGSAISTNNGIANGNSRVSITIDGGVVEAQDGHAITFHSGGTLKMLRGSLISDTSNAIYAENGAGSPSIVISGGTVSTNGTGSASGAIVAHAGSVEISGDAHVFGANNAVSISGDSLAIGGNALVETGSSDPAARAVTIGRQARVHIKENATVRSAAGTAIGSISTAFGLAGVNIEGGAVSTESGVAIAAEKGGLSLTGGTVSAGNGKAIVWSTTSQNILTIGENAAVIADSGTAIARMPNGGYDYEANLNIAIDSPNVKVGPGGTLIEARGGITLTSPHDIVADGGRTLIHAPLTNPHNRSIPMNISTDSPVRVVGAGSIAIDAGSRLTLGGSSSIVASGGADAIVVRTNMYQTQGYYGPGDIIEVGGDVTVNIPVIAEIGAPVKAEKVAVIGGTGVIEAKGAGDAAIHSLAKDAILTINTAMLKTADSPLIKADNGITIKGSGHIAAGDGVAIEADGNVKVADENIRISATNGTAIITEGDVVVESGLVFAYGDAIVGNGNVIVAGGEVVADGEGMAIAWNEAAGVREYQNGRSHDLSKLFGSASAKAVWGPDVDADPAGIVYASGDNNGLIELPVSIIPLVKEPHLTSISLAPTHIILENANDIATIEANFDPDVDDYDSIIWSVERAVNSGVAGANLKPALNAVKDDLNDWTQWVIDGENGKALLETIVVAAVDGKRIEIRATEDGLASGETLRVRASYDGRYTAIATIEMLPQPTLSADIIKARIPDAVAVVNKAKHVGARIPIVIEHADKEKAPLGPMAMSEREMRVPLPLLDDDKILGAARLVESVEIGHLVAGVFTPWQPEAIKANISLEDDRFLEISADMGVKNGTAKNLVARLKARGAENHIYTNAFNIQIVERYPSYKIMQDVPMNIRYANVDTTLSVVANDGSKVDVTAVQVVPTHAKSHEMVVVQADGKTLRPGVKAGKPQLNVSVANHEYKHAIKPKATNNNGNTIKTTAVAVIGTMPAVKLDRAAVAVVVPGDARIYQSLRDANAVKPTVKLGLVAKNAKMPFEQGYEVEAVNVSRLDSKGRLYTSPHVAIGSDERSQDGVSARYIGSNGAMGEIELTLKPNMQAANGRVWLEVVYKGMGESQANKTLLAVNITARDPHAIKASINPKAYTVNNSLAAGRVADGSVVAEVPITLNVANVELNDWMQPVDGKETTNTLTAWVDNDRISELGESADRNTPGVSPLNVVPPMDGLGAKAPNSLELVANAKELDRLAADGKNKKYALTLTSPSLINAKGMPVMFTLGVTVATGEPRADIAFGRGNIDVTSQGSFKPAAVRLKNTTSAVSEVRLYEQKFHTVGNKKVLALDRAELSRDFTAVMTGPHTFNVVVREGREGHVRPKVTQRLSVEVVLENGQALQSWTANAAGVGKDRHITINPAVSTPKANPARLADVSLYVDQPMQGAKMTAIAFDASKAPANAKIGHVQIQFAGVQNFESEGFRLERNGEQEWSMHFADDIRPYIVNNPLAGVRVLNKDGSYTQLKKSYNLRIEVWAEGTYQLKADGTPMLDGTGRVVPHLAANNRTDSTKPVILTQKVFIR